VTLGVPPTRIKPAASWISALRIQRAMNYGTVEEPSSFPGRRRKSRARFSATSPMRTGTLSRSDRAPTSRPADARRAWDADLSTDGCGSNLKVIGLSPATSICCDAGAVVVNQLRLIVSATAILTSESENCRRSGITVAKSPSYQLNAQEVFWEVCRRSRQKNGAPRPPLCDRSQNLTGQFWHGPARR